MSEYETRLRMEQLFLETRGDRIKKAPRQIASFDCCTRRRDAPLENTLMSTLAKKGLGAAMEKLGGQQASGIVCRGGEN
jgi:hypothetical protein